MTTTPRTFGLEEEFMLVDPVTLEQHPAAERVLARLAPALPPGVSAAHEFLASQIEHASPVFSDRTQAIAELAAFRRRLAAAAGQEGLAVYSAGMPFQASAYPDVTDEPRYDRVRDRFGGIIADHQINGLHVRVAVPDRESGVRVLNHVRGWLPTLLALSGNSPFWRGTDTGFASWRTIMMQRWVTHGCPPHFADAADYDRRLRQLVGIGGTIDVATVAWNARLSESYPTVEFRVFDAQLQAEESVLLAVLARGLVQRALHSEAAGPDPELLNAALWHAARDGLSDQLVLEGQLVPARVAVEALVDHAELDDDDRAFVRAGVVRLLSHGTGAARQRWVYAEAGVVGLSELHSLVDGAMPVE